MTNTRVAWPPPATETGYTVTHLAPFSAPSGAATCPAALSGKEAG